MKLQSVMFDKQQWSAITSRNWLLKHGYRPIKPVDITINLLRYRIAEPNYKRYITKQLPNGISLIFGS